MITNTNSYVIISSDVESLITNTNRKTEWYLWDETTLSNYELFITECIENPMSIIVYSKIMDSNEYVNDNNREIVGYIRNILRMANIVVLHDSVIYCPYIPYIPMTTIPLNDKITIDKLCKITKSNN